MLLVVMRFQVKEYLNTEVFVNNQVKMGRLQRIYHGFDFVMPVFAEIDAKTSARIFTQDSKLIKLEPSTILFFFSLIRNRISSPFLEISFIERKIYLNPSITITSLVSYYFWSSSLTCFDLAMRIFRSY